MWWLYLPLAFADYQVFLIIQEDPDGHRSLYDCTRRWPDGRVEQLDGVRATIHYTPGTRIPYGAHIEMMTRDGSRLQLDVESKLFAPIAFGSGYGGDSSWSHGTWKGGPSADRVSYDLTDPDVMAEPVQFDRPCRPSRLHRTRRQHTARSGTVRACRYRSAPPVRLQ